MEMTTASSRHDVKLFIPRDKMPISFVRNTQLLRCYIYGRQLILIFNFFTEGFSLFPIFFFYFMSQKSFSLKKSLKKPVNTIVDYEYKQTEILNWQKPIIRLESLIE